MWEELPMAGTTYSDLKGTVAADFHTSVTDFHDVIRAMGVPERYFPIGIDLLGTNLLIARVWAVDTEVAGTSYNEIE